MESTNSSRQGSRSSTEDKKSISLALVLLLSLLSLSLYFALSSTTSKGEYTPPNVSVALKSAEQTLETVNSTSVVLITGDEVHVFYLRNGQVRVAINPVPSKTERDFKIFETPSGLYVIPNDVDLDKYDLELFNVKLLAEQIHVTGISDRLRVIVQGATPDQINAVVAFVKDFAQRKGLKHEAKVIHPKLNLASLTLDLGDRAKLNELFKSMPNFKKVWLDRAHKIPISGGVAVSGGSSGENLQIIGAPWVWVNTQATGDGVKIAILDTGIDFTHKDFKFMNGTSKIIAAKSFVDWPPEEVNNATDYHGHGTHVSGIAAGTGLTMFNSSYLSPIAHPLVVRRGNDEAAIMAGNGTHLVVVWHSDVSGNWDIWALIYDGEMWHGPIQLTVDSGRDVYPYVSLLSNNRILVMWYSNRTGTSKIWYKVYLNGTWTEDRQLTTDPTTFDIMPAFVELPDGTIALIWSRGLVGSNTTNIYFAKLTMAPNGTLTFINGSIMPLTNAPSNHWYIARSLLLSSAGMLWAFWDDLSTYNFETHWGGITHMYYNVTIDYGGSWSGAELYSCSGCISPTAVELNNGTVIVFFQGDDYKHNVPDTIYYMKYVNGSWHGPFWLPSDTWHGWRPSAAYGPGGLYIAFTHWAGDYYGDDIMVITPKPIYMGVAPKALLLEGKVLNGYGWGFDSWIINGIYWAVESGADVISMSLGGWPTSGEDPLSQTVNWAYDQGVVVIVAAGNWGPEYFTISTPGSAEKAITVGAAESPTSIAWFSSRGPVKENFRVKPEIVAPGVGVCSSVPEYIYGHSYGCWSGTSMATPHVAGAVALMYHYLARSGYQINAPRNEFVKSWLLTSATQDAGYDVYTQGAGLLNLTKAFVREVGGFGGNMIHPPVISFGPIVAGTNASRNITICEWDVNRTYVFEVTAQDVVTGEFRNISSITPSTISVNRGSCGKVTLTISPTAPSGLYSGKIVARDNYGYTYNVVFGVFIGYNLTIRKIPMEGPGNEWAVSGDFVGVFRLDPASWLERGYGFFDERGVISFFLLGGHYEIYTVGEWNNQPVFVIYDNLTLSGNTEVVLDEQSTYPVTFNPNKERQVFAEVFHGLYLPLGESVEWLRYYPTTPNAYYSYSNLASSVDRYVYYPEEDLNPSAPNAISTKTWHDLLYVERGISQPINRVVNYSEVVMKYTEYRTAATPRQSALRISWAWREEGPWATFTWLMNVPYERVEVVSPSTWYDGFYKKYRDVPGVETPYWEYYGWIQTGEPGSNIVEIWGEQPLFQTVKYVWSFARGDGTYDIFLGAESFADSNHEYRNVFHARYPLDELYVELYRDGTPIPREEYNIYIWWRFWGDYYITLYSQRPAKFALKATARERQTLTTETRLYYEFELSPDGEVTWAPRLVNLDVRGLTLNNTLEKPTVEVVFELYNQSKVHSVTFEYSTDGATWIQAPVNTVGPNTYSAQFTIYGGQQYVSMRINATDSNNLKASIVVIQGFVLNASGIGRLRVETIPPVPTRIFLDGIVRNSWGLDWVRVPAKEYVLSFSDVAYYQTPKEVVVTIWPDNITFVVPLTKPIPVYPGKTTEVKAYFQRLGSLRVETYPPVPVTIYVNGTEMNEWGLWVDIEPGTYVISFEPYAGYRTPPPVTVRVEPGKLTHVIGNFTSGETIVK